MKVRFVFDASPLIHLVKAGLSPMISDLEGEKYTVPAVIDEVVGRGAEPRYADAAMTSSLVGGGILKVRAPSAKTVKAIASAHRDIHSGESEVLALAKEMGAVAIIDDRVARAVARIQGVRVEGTYGVILRAAANQSISREEAEDALGRLVTSGWRCDAELYGALLKTLREVVRRSAKS